MHYLIGIRAMGRGDFTGAPPVAPVFAVATDDLEHRKNLPVLIHIATDAVFKPKYGRKELKRYLDGDPATFPFIRTVSWDDLDVAKPILVAADTSLADLT